MKSRFLVFVLLVFGLFIAGVQTTSAAQKTVYSGRATVLDANVLNIVPVTLVDTGQLPPEGGALHETALEINLPGILTSGIAHAATTGQAKYVNSEAGVVDANVSLLGNAVTLSADIIMAQAEALCASAKKGNVKGSSTIAGLVLNGTPINVTGKPNQTIELPLLVGNVKLVINEQIVTKSGNNAAITVNAIHLTVTSIVGTIADVVIGHAEAGVLCAKQAQCPTKNSASGMGTIQLPSGKASFSFSGGIKNGDFFGKLKYNDKAGTKLDGTGVTDYKQTGAKSRQIVGTAKLNGGATVTYTLDIVDGGKPNKDTFRLRLSNGYDTGVQKLVGTGGFRCGNIRVHKPCK